MRLDLDRHPVIVAIAGPNGAGKSTFFEQVVQPTQLKFVNADVLAKENGWEAYEAADMAARLRAALVERGESFVFETILSDPVGAKVTSLRAIAEKGYNVVLCFIGLNSASESSARVALRVTRGGHDVPDAKLSSRYPRTLENLVRAMKALPCVLVYDNSDLADSFRFITEYRDGVELRCAAGLPAWFQTVREQWKM